MRAAILLALCVLSRSACAAEWELLTILSPADGILAVDAHSIAKAGELKKAWFKWTYVKDQPMPRGVPRAELAKDKYLDSLTLEYFNCEERTSATIQSIYHGSDGAVVGSQSIPPGVATYIEVSPESIGETMLDRVCNGTKPPGMAELAKPAAKEPNK